MGRPRGSINRPFLERFWSKVDIQSEDECWLWTGAVSRYGYGDFTVRGAGSVRVTAHQIAYEVGTGQQIPAGYDAHHVCGNRLCTNPQHVELLSRSEHGRLHAIQRWAGHNRSQRKR